VYWLIWLMGSVVCRIYLNHKIELDSKLKKVLIRILDALATLFVLWVMWKVYFGSMWYSDIIEDLLFGIAISYLTFRLLFSKKPLFAFPKILNKSSDYSYSLYLIHYPIVVLLYALFSSGLEQFLICLVIVTILTLFFNRLTNLFASINFTKYEKVKVLAPKRKK